MNKKAFSLIELSIVILIIGILIAGVTQSSRLITQMKLASARQITQSSPVNSITGIFLWAESTGIDATDINDPEDSQAITTWKDINPQSLLVKNDITQGNATKRPLYKTNALNGLPALRFDGIDDYLSKTSVSSNSFSSTSQNTIFFVLKSNSSSGTQILFDYESSNTNRILVQIQSTLFPRFDFVNDTTGLLSGTAAISSSNASVLTLEKKSGNQKIYINGTVQGSKLNSLSFSPFTAEMAIGYYVPAQTFFVAADIGEIIIFDRALKDEERESIEAYLGKKWGVNILP
jgi:prepilin-type N-terminal cleavage/methylation domain-containing protein